MRADMNAEQERDHLNSLSNRIIGAALRVHEELGPGMLESVYEACLMYELLNQGFLVERQKPVAVVYRGNQLDCGFRIDLLVEAAVAVEVKAIERLERLHSAQVRTHLRFSHLKLGLLINFNVGLLREGLRRIVYEFPD